ncbi:MAG TPA: hypothetical protein PLX69_13960 [Leptospiraceae bacterium]|nr:hypothetical protein [Leptospiraceae bacterium]HRG75662.1 hypothetical protein [Leptospiraceae bacterium]
MNNSIYLILGSLWVGCAFAFLYTYDDYREFVEYISIILSISSAIITLWQTFHKK